MESTPKQHLDLIAEMIQTARREYNDSSNIYLLWGWVVSIASILQFILIQMHHDSISWIGWAVLIPFALIAQVVMMIKMRGREKVQTHIDTIMGYLWTAFGVSLAIVLFSQGKLQESTFPMVLMLYGIGTFVSGGAIQFRALIIGGIFCWVFAIGCYFVHMEYQLLLLALAVIAAYIIPGYLLKIRYKKNV
jgi:hypothetical protein